MRTAEGRRPPWQYVEVALAAAVIALAVVGLALWPLTTSACVRGLVVLVGSEDFTGLDRADTLATAEAVRQFVTDRGAPSLPAEVGGAPGFDADAVSHLVDVRNVLIPARTLALIAGALAIIWCALRARTGPGRRLVGSALRAAGWLLIGGGGLALAAGLLDFDRLFAAFHGLFFAPGTWMFPDDALLIRVFPLPFWTAAGALWALFVLGAAVVLIVVGGRLRFTSDSDGV